MKSIKQIALDSVETAVKLSIERIWEWSKQVTDIPWLTGVIVKNDDGGNQITLVAGNNKIAHRLGRAPQGFIVIGFEGATSENYPSMVSKDAKFMVLNSLDPMVLKLWVWG